MTKSSALLTKDTTGKKSKHSTMGPPPQSGSAPNSGKKKSKSQFSTTPVAKGSSTVTKTSTPTADGSLFRTLDTSAIEQHHSGMGTPNTTQGSQLNTNKEKYYLKM